MTDATYYLEVDSAGDSSYALDITAYIRSANGITWSLGMSKAYDTFARAATMEVEVGNEGRKFSPESTDLLTGISIGQLIRVRMNYDSTTVTKYTGRIDDIIPLPGKYAGVSASIRCVGYMQRLQTVETAIPLQINKRTDEIIAALLDGVSTLPPALPGAFRLGLSTLGEDTILIDGVSDYSELDTGDHTFAYAGDNWDEGISVYKALKDVVETEGGMFYVNEAGKIIFKRRSYKILDMANPVDETLDETDLSDMRYVYGDRLLNRINFDLYPRTVGTSLEVLGLMEEPSNILSGVTLKLTINFTDDTGNKIGGTDVVEPTSGDYNVTPTTSIAITTTIYSDHADFEIEQNSGSTVVLNNLQIRGKKVTTYGKVSISADDSSSIAEYGLQQENKRMKLLDDVEYAQSLATHLVHTR